MPNNLTWNNKLGVYLDGEKPILWTYYDHPKAMTNLMRLSLGTISCHNNYGLSIIIATDEEVVRLLGTVHEVYQYLSPNHKSDYFRVHIIEKYGGAYVDLDVIALGPSVGTYAWLRHYDMVGQIHGPVISVGYLGPARARNRLFAQWAAAQDALLSHYAPAMERYAAARPADYPIPWSAVIHVGGGLQRLFADYLRRRGTAVKLFDGTRFTAQLSYSRADFNQTTNVTSLTAPVTLNRAPFVYWHNALLAPMWPMRVDEIFASDFLFVELLARSHALCRSSSRRGERAVDILPGRLSLGQLLVEPAQARMAHDGQLRRLADGYSARCFNAYLADRERANGG